MEFLKNNKKQILTIIILLLIIFVTKKFGANDASDSVQSTAATNETVVQESTSEVNETVDEIEIKYTFRNNGLWEEHFEKHGAEFPYDTKEDYLLGANIMLSNPDKLHKTEKEDGDDAYYLESTNEFIIVSTDGYLRTYFKPRKGKEYFDRQ